MNSDVGLLILRVGFGGMLMTHGWPKVQNLLAGNHEFGDPLGIGPAASLFLSAAAEFLFALLVLLGVKVRWTAIPPAINMAVASFLAHAGDPFPKREKALCFLVAFVALIFTGGGRYGLDALFTRSRRAAKG
jgi:putative oxidoreductase